MTTPSLREAELGPAEKLLDLLLNASGHLWHHRPGFDLDGVWHARRGAKPEVSRRGSPVTPGLFVPAAVGLYARLLDLYGVNVELAARFASYALKETDWRDLKVACAALMLVQQRSGQPVHEDDGSVAFYDDDYRRVGEAMLLFYEKKSPRMLTPKAVLRVAELLETPQIAELNHIAGFGDPASKKAPLGRWKRAATKWLALREKNQPLLEGLISAGYKETIKKIARKAGYKPESERFFALLGWKQKQAEGGHRTVGLGELVLEKRERFDGLSEAEICEAIESQRLKYKDVVGRLPKDIGLTPAIMVALLPTLSDRDLRIITPTLEDLGLMAEPSIRDHWEKAMLTATDQRSLNIAKNVKDEGLKAKLEEAAEHAIQVAVAEATRETDVRLLFLVDKSGSMSGAIEQSIEALTRILAGFPSDKLHVATFDTMGTVLVPKAPTRAGVQHMLSGIRAEGGTIHGAAVQALRRSGVRFPSEARVIVIVVGDEAGEAGPGFARALRTAGYEVAAFALLLNVAVTRGATVRDAAEELDVPFSEIRIEQFDDPYQVPRVLRALLAAPRSTSPRQYGLVEKVMATPLLELPRA